MTAVCAVLAVVCSLAVAAAPLPVQKSAPPKGTAPSAASGRNQAASYFFGGQLDDYGFSLDLKMRRKLFVLRAHRRINPCGLVDPVKLVAADPDFQQYGADGDLSACAVVFRGDAPSVVTVKVSQNPPTMREVSRFSVGSVVVHRHAPAEPGTCLYVFDLGISQLPSAPERLTDFQAQITAPEDRGEEPCVRGHAVAAAAAARVVAKGAPQWLRADPIAKVGEADPCLPARKVAGATGLSDADVGTHWCGFRMGPTLVKLSVRLRPAQFANQQGDPWNVIEAQTTPRGDRMLLVYNGAFDAATGSYRPSSDKLHCDVYLMVKTPLLPRSVDASEVDESETRLATVEVRSETAPCSVNREIATAWAAQLG
ncbi:hypothetical protein [Segniliparus rugosus]|uniref:Uncharacterized protein n=1 Tax=Segniliparus rugosus (strain ATCC BAA-974 / DSM 45345 / CCUG 50838 / CIP 108380 / JCM 13579 / CDC 945) TaxID=679197 RepID=E5XUW2_SEGRC|nr:hypothetical protein [Segniliparus rugosus]EFV11798.1 hypothetical protein HMPREF9336_03284 [Segniliparus rugosus ATCC BAA-974]